jgi:hypothetical protein
MMAERKSKTDESEIKTEEEDQREIHITPQPDAGLTSSASSSEEGLQLEYPIPAETQTETGERIAKIDLKEEKRQEKEDRMLSNIAKTMSLQYGEDSVVLLKDKPEKAIVSNWISTGNYAIVGSFICRGSEKRSHYCSV